MTDGTDMADHDAGFLRDWLVSLKILHRAHWNAARWYERVSNALGVATAVCAAIAGTSAFADNAPALVTGGLALVAAVIAAVQTSLRAAESAARHKQAGIRFGQLRRDLEARLMLGLPPDDAARAVILSEFREHWSAADDESPAAPRRFFVQATRSVHEESKRGGAAGGR